MLRYAERKEPQTGDHLESFSTRHTGHLVFACAIGIVIRFTKLATAFDDAVHALANSHLLQKTLSMNLRLLA